MQIIFEHLTSVAIGLMILGAVVFGAMAIKKHLPEFYTWALYGTSFIGVCEIFKLTKLANIF